MEKVISATEARIHFGEVLRQAQHGPVIVERGGKQKVVILSKRAYDELIGSHTQRGWRDLLKEAHQRVREETAGIELPPTEDMIRQMRAEQYNLPAAYEAHYLALALRLGIEM